MKINPKTHKDAYSSQESRGSFDVPPSGTYLAVNTRFSRVFVGDKGTPAIKVTTRILECVAVEDQATLPAAKAWVGKDIQQTLWANFTKQGNVERVACLAIGCGFMDEFDPENDASLVGAITGVAYQLKGQRKEEEWQGKTNVNFNVSATQMLSAAKRKEFVSAPDWAKLVGDPASRVIAGDAKKSNGKAQHAPQQQTKVQDSDPFAPSAADDDGQIPF